MSESANERRLDPLVGKTYPCPLAGAIKTGNKFCRYGGNKPFNYAFARGTKPFCRKARRWITNMLTGQTITCPFANKEGQHRE